jgi:cob(I)alamin adenosyltransferase
MRLTKIYTKVGDKGTTGLANGEEVSKSSLRIEAYGTVDELNAHVGFFRDLLLEEPNAETFPSLIQQLKAIQNELFNVGGELSTPANSLDISRQQVVTEASTKRLETEMDFFNESLPPLANFILPGGHKANSAAHLARTVCRRAERCVVRLAESESIRREVQIYLNRLSDWFFVVGRVVSKKLEVPEVLWEQNKKK